MIIISTKTGDKGESSLANGQRVKKSSLVFEVIGTLDELNSWLGLIIAKLDSKFASEKKFLLKIQEKLFVMGAEIAKSPQTKLTSTLADTLEKKVITVQKKLTKNWQTKFLLPGGTELGAYLDLSRAVSRRLERKLWLYAEQAQVSTSILKTTNRLSDYLYMLRCLVNQELNYQEKLFDSKKSVKSIKKT